MGMLRRAGAILTGYHFVYASRQHGPDYINVDRMFGDVDPIEQLCRLLSEPFRGRVDTVIGPAVGGVVLSFATAAQYPLRPRPQFVWADKSPGGELLVERGGFGSRLEGARVLVVEDMLTTGSSVRKVIFEVARHGGEVIGLSAVGNRSGLTAAQLDVPRLEALVSVKLASFHPDACPLCKAGQPIVADVGRGGEYRRRYPDYPGGYINIYNDAA